jgi:hypothetical protein
MTEVTKPSDCEAAALSDFPDCHCKRSNTMGHWSETAAAGSTATRRRVRCTNNFNLFLLAASFGHRWCS